MKIHHSLGYLLNISTKMIKNFNFYLKEYYLTTSQWAVTKVISENSSLTQVQICKFLNFDKATSGTVIDKLIKKEFVYKKINNEDTGTYHIFLTEKSYKIINEVTEKSEFCIQNSVKGIDNKNLKTCFSVLEKLFLIWRKITMNRQIFFQIFLIILGIIEIFTNSFYIFGKNKLSKTKIQYKEFLPYVTEQQLKIKVIFMLLFGCLFLITGIFFFNKNYFSLFIFILILFLHFFRSFIL